MSNTSSGNVSFFRKLGVLAGLTALTVAGVADAFPLPPGGAGSPTGTSAALDPSLVGPVMASQIIPFTCGGVTGALQNWVTRNTSGEMDIYYRFVNTTGNDRIVGGILENYSASSTVDFDYRTDMGGTFAPSSASRSAAGDTIQFTFLPSAVSPGASSMPIVVRSGRPKFDDGGRVTVLFGSTAPCAINKTYQPL